MGTNYEYFDQEPCHVCGRGGPGRHIGKSSGGWCFSLHVYPEDGIDDLPAWIDLMWKKDSFILNEYGDTVSVENMIEIITERGWHSRKEKDREWYSTNRAVPGPNGLARHEIDGVHCIGHGEGTWDLITGDFS